MRQVLRPGALGRPRGRGWGGRWEGGSGWGLHVNPWLIHVNVWQKPLQYYKVISLQLIKINGKKKHQFKINKEWEFNDQEEKKQAFQWSVIWKPTKILKTEEGGEGPGSLTVPMVGDGFIQYNHL